MFPNPPNSSRKKHHLFFRAGFWLDFPGIWCINRELYSLVIIAQTLAVRKLAPTVIQRMVPRASCLHQSYGYVGGKVCGSRSGVRAGQIRKRCPLTLSRRVWFPAVCHSVRPFHLTFNPALCPAFCSPPLATCSLNPFVFSATFYVGGGSAATAMWRQQTLLERAALRGVLLFSDPI